MELQVALAKSEDGRRALALELAATRRHSCEALIQAAGRCDETLATLAEMEEKHDDVVTQGASLRRSLNESKRQLEALELKHAVMATECDSLRQKLAEAEKREIAAQQSQQQLVQELAACQQQAQADATER